MSGISNLRSERYRLGMSQEELGELVGRRRATIGRWERDPAQIPGPILVQLSKKFDCSIDYLLGFTDERTSKRNKVA